MIPQNLIDKIHKGRAEFKTFPCGVGGNIILQCPKKSYIVILGFSYSHFCDLKSINFPEVRANCVHHVQFKSVNKNRYNYTFRTNFVSIDVTPFFQISNPAEYRKAYQVHDSDIHIDIWRMNSGANWVNIINAVASSRTNNENTPLSYGTPADAFAVPSVRQILMDPPTGEYHPQGDNAGIPTNNGYRSQFIGDINSVTGLNPPIPANPFVNWSFPILNVDYVLVNEQTNENTK
jgi:hypothetical protein